MPAPITNIEDLRLLAQRRVPRMFYNHADSGSWTEGTYRANSADFQNILLRQRVAVNMEGRSTRSTMIGQEVAMPVAIAPTGLTGMQHADGEILGALAAKKFGIPFTLSTMSICSIEDIAEALVVSNHGGRQLDGVPSSIRALPAIADAVGSRIEVHMDGGIRSGQDVLKARALGARGTYIGRAFLYGLGAMGEAGVTKALQLIRNELDITMAFCGRTDIETVDKSILLPGTYPT